MKLLATILIASSFLLNLLGYLLYDSNISYKEQDYVFNMIAWSFSIFIASIYLMGGLKVLFKPNTYLKCVYKTFFMFWFFSSSFAAMREQFAGFNDFVVPMEIPFYFGTLIGIAALLIKIDYSRVKHRPKY